jgi:hypothetical protein
VRGRGRGGGRGRGEGMPDLVTAIRHPAADARDLATTTPPASPTHS